MGARWLPIAAFTLGLFVATGLAVMAAGASPLGLVVALLRGSLGSPSAISGTLREMSPLLITGLAVFVALRAGLFNIGAEGQFIVGAMVCAAVALRIAGPVGMVAGGLAGLVAGAMWAFPAGWIRAYRGGHEVISTIMLNNVAILLTEALVAGPLKDRGAGSSTTNSLGPGSRLPAPLASPIQVSLALVAGIVLCFTVRWWLAKTVAGYELRAVGANATAAQIAGIDTRQTLLRAMLGSGALAGLAGGFQVLAFEGRFYDGFSPGYGFDALGVALLAGNSTLAVIPTSLLFGVLAKGGTALAIDGIPKGITGVILGVLILVAAVSRYRKAVVRG